MQNGRLIDKLLTRPSFTAKEARGLGLHPSLLAYYTKQGVFERVSRGVYKNPKSKSDEHFNIEDLLITASSIPDGVICLISALSYYDMTDEIPRSHWIAVPNSVRAPKRDHTRIVRMRNISLGKEAVKIGKFSTHIFDRERCVVDAFKHLGVEVGVKALRAYLKTTKNRRPDFKKLNQYAKTLRVSIDKYILALTT